MKGKSAERRYLEQVQKLDKIIENKMIERRQWRELAMTITKNTDEGRVRTNTEKSRMASAINRCVDMDAEIDRAVEQMVKVKRDVCATLEQLESPIEYMILHERYIQYKPLKVIAEEHGMEYTNVTTIHGRGTAHVMEILRKRG